MQEGYSAWYYSTVLLHDTTVLYSTDVTPQCNSTLFLGADVVGLFLEIFKTCCYTKISSLDTIVKDLIEILICEPYLFQFIWFFSSQNYSNARLVAL